MDYAQEQEMEVEALQAILMDDIQVLETDGLDTQSPSYQIKITSEDEGETAQVNLIFAHTPNYPDEPPLLDVRGGKGVRDSEAKELKQKLQAEATENLGMAMMYTLATSAKEWLSLRFAQEDEGSGEDEEEAPGIDEVVEPHGEVVTVETFVAWRERFEAELALERARLMPESALTTTKDKRLSGRAWFESGRASAVVNVFSSLGLGGWLSDSAFEMQRVGKPVAESSEEEAEEDIDFDADYDDEDLDEDDMLEHYLSQKATI
ncbi:RWD domain-containing protein 1 isoform X2 [Selaginella moellendorffii]|uniref:RWD domain-containing protein 1 isoform X2 n=1 Tax=Selaginella moellendorffii TaxID=88036 RepID=UPI000D1D01B8|nr:RWD domain-containing protein 1 isoform X2 [Selaginella moellendorffii]|eukprot:XP_024516442.1 RWD domain-containing protein 1 isoform X2 [Selaginella moellendorffii]